ncbi:MAG: alpha-galactosidase [Clostridia bacterium]|nr:alpha-galactosidase [Clostridia bacterium]
MKHERTYLMSDMTVSYPVDESTGVMSLRILPCGKEDRAVTKPHDRPEPLIQAKIIGDAYPGGYASGRTMRWSATTDQMRFQSQSSEDKDGVQTIRTVLEDPRGIRWHHELSHRDGADYLVIRSGIENLSREPVTLEMMTSFCLGGLTPFCEGDGFGRLRIHRIRSNWAAEGFVDSRAPEEMHLETAWLRQCATVERFGQVGSMPVRKFFPLLAVEDKKEGVTWAAELTCGASWQLEVGRRDDGILMDGGLADREFGGWLKTVRPGEVFYGPEAILTVCRGGLDDASQRLISYTRDRVRQPDSEKDLPVLFNEYCTTWGVPQEDQIRRIVDAVRPLGLRYFVIDAGWYLEDKTKDWWDTTGSWNPSPFLFSRGLDDTLNYIREAGIRPGIWFEPESIGIANPLFTKTEWLLHRDGVPLQTGKRRYLDFRLPEVRAYVREKVIRFLAEHRIDYIKVDYNDSIGLGVDGAESLGEGLRQHVEGVQNFLRELRETLPEVVLEICSSGGHRLVPSFLEIGAMGSFSDAHECEEIPLIAGHTQRFVWPAQSQIWAVLHADFEEKQLYYKLSAGFLGRLCLSGDVLDFNPEQWETIAKMVNLYREVYPVIRDGRSEFLGPKPVSWRHPQGWQAVIRRTEGTALIVVHSFENAPEEITLPWEGPEPIAWAAAREGIRVRKTEKGLQILGISDYDGIVLKI